MGLYKHQWRLLLTLNQCILNLCVSYLSVIGILYCKTVCFQTCNQSYTSCLQGLAGLHCGMLTRDNAWSICLQRKSSSPFPELISHRYNHKSQFTCWQRAGGRFYPWVEHPISAPFTKDQRRGDFMWNMQPLRPNFRNPWLSFFYYRVIYSSVHLCSSLVWPLLSSKS